MKEKVFLCESCKRSIISFVNKEKKIITCKLGVKITGRIDSCSHYSQDEKI